MAANYTTFNEIIDILRDISTRHYQLNTFFLGKDFDLENSADIVYPMFQVYPTLARLPQSNGEYQTIQITLNCKVIDLTQQSDENLADVHSDTLQIAQDIINEINQHPFYQYSNVTLVGDINLTNLEEFEDDYGAGWAFELSLQLRNNQAFCGSPIDPKTGWSFNGPVATGYTYTAPITCEDLIDCPVIINLQDQIDSIVISADTYTVGGSYSAGTLTLIRNDGDLIPITGFMTTDIYWTSGSTGHQSIKAKNDSGLDATGDYAVAEGYGTLASGNYSHAEGGGIASGIFSHAEGDSTIASGDYSHSEGYQTTASGIGSHAEGYQTTVLGIGPITVTSGYTWTASDPINGDFAIIFPGNVAAEWLGYLSYCPYAYGSVYLGVSVPSDEWSSDFCYIQSFDPYGIYYDIGTNSTYIVNGVSSIQMWNKIYLNTTGQTYSTVYTKAINTGAHAEGGGTTASGIYSHAEGSLTTAFGNQSHAGGYQSIASGNYSHAGGYFSTASGTTSFVHGNTSQANGLNTIVLGANIIGNTANTTYVDKLNIKTATGTSVTTLGLDANGFVVSGASSGTDIYVTGGTYNPINGTTTLLRNDNGTVVISGYSTGTSFTGGTVSGSTNFLSTILSGGTNLSSLFALASTSGGVIPNSTGIISGGVLSLGTGTTTFSITNGTGMIANNTSLPATITNVTWSGKTNITATYIGAGLVSYIAIDSTGAVVQQLTPFTNTQHRQYITLGSLIHVNLTTLDAVNQFGEVIISPANQLSDLSESLGKFNITGNIYSANGANLNLNKSTGTIYSQGSNWGNNTSDPNVVTLSALTALSFQYRFQTGTNGATGIAINPDIYDVAGVSTAVPNNKFTVQRIFSFVSNNVKIQPGQSIYNSLAEAKGAIQTESFVVETSIQQNGILRGFLVIKQGTTSLTNTSNVFFYEAGKFGSQVGIGGQSVSTLQNAYDNSNNPEILTNSILGAVTIKDGVGGNVLEIQNTGGTITTYITGDGTISTNKVTNLADAVNPTDAVTLNQLSKTQASSNLFNFYNFS